MNRVKAFLTGLNFLLFICFTFAQTDKDYKVLSLPQVIELARSQSPAAKLATTTYENNYWRYKNFKSNYRPQLVLNGVLPDYNSSINSITQNDGTEQFRRRSLSNSSVDISLSQNIGLTGTQVFMSSQLQRIDIFTPKSVSYLANPAVIGLRQSLFAFNSLGWDRKIEPLKFEESKRQLNEDMESVSIRATELFFNLLLAQIREGIEVKNLANNDTLYKISRGRYNLGKIAENDLLQMELSVMNARNNLSQAQLDVELGTLQLKTFLKLTGNEKLTLVEPILIPYFEVDENTALQQAQKNRQQVIEFERQRLEAQRDVARAKGERGLNADLSASYGLTQSAVVIPDLYVNPQDQQRLRFGFQVPILDWGRGKSQVKTALANLALVETNIEQAEQNFNQEVLFSVKQLRMYKTKLVIAAKSDTIALKRYDITMKRYLIGKISIVDLNIALQEKDQAKLSYVLALRTYWNTYFELRRKTLYDFEKNAPIVFEKK